MFETSNDLSPTTRQAAIDLLNERAFEPRRPRQTSLALRASFV